MSKSKFIIIEGPDRCGKSTLAASLSKLLGPQTICAHSGTPPKVEDAMRWEIEHYLHMVNAMRLVNETAEMNFIADRFHIGVPVYGQRFRNYSKDVTAGVLENHIFNPQYVGPNIDVKLILVTDSLQSIMSRDDGLGLETEAVQMQSTIDEFKYQFSTSKLSKVHFDISEIGFSNLLPQAMKFLELE